MFHKPLPIHELWGRFKRELLTRVMALSMSGALDLPDTGSNRKLREFAMCFLNS